MKIIKPFYAILTKIDEVEILKRLEIIGRNAYKSEDKIANNSCYKFIEMIVNKGHLGILEHELLTVRFICDRAIANEIVRHRIASYVQESSRYCDYTNDKFDNELVFIEPFFIDNDYAYNCWVESMKAAENMYFKLRNLYNFSPQEARCILPLSLKTDIVVTMNLRSWKYFLELRTAKESHPQIKELTTPLYEELKIKLPTIFL